MFKVKMMPGWEGKFKKDASREIGIQLAQRLPMVVGTAELLIQQAVLDRLQQSETYRSIASGRLKFELGLPDGAQRIQTVVEAWISGIEVKFVFGVGDFGSIVIGILDEAYQDVLSLDASEISVSNKKGQTFNLEWLKWLLTEGRRQIVTEYRYTTRSRRRGRAGGGIMVPRAGSFWRVPSEFAGTEANNFATKALIGIEGQIDGIMRMTLGKL